MGTVDPIQSTAKQAPRKTGRLTGVGITAVGFGFLVFTAGVFAGFNLILVGIGLAFIAGGVISKTKRLCPSCKLAVPPDASVCGHCRASLA